MHCYGDWLCLEMGENYYHRCKIPVSVQTSNNVPGAENTITPEPKYKRTDSGKLIGGA